MCLVPARSHGEHTTLITDMSNADLMFLSTLVPPHTFPTVPTEVEPFQVGRSVPGPLSAWQMLSSCQQQALQHTLPAPPPKTLSVWWCGVRSALD